MVGPSDSSLPAKLANIGMILALAANGYAFVHLYPDLIVMTYLNLSLGIFTLILMWMVQCSDPGVQARDKASN